MDERNTIGTRLRAARRSRDLTQEQLAERSAISKDTIAKLEQGQRTSARLGTLISLARALDMPLSQLTDTGDRIGADRNGGVQALRDALIAPELLPGFDPADDTPPAAPAALAATVTRLWGRYWAGAFGDVVAVLPAAIGEARAARHAAGDAAAQPLAQAYDLAANLLVHLGRDDLAALASERAITAAAGCGDETLWAMLHGTYSWILLRQARPEAAESVAARTAQRIEPSFSSSDHVRTAAWGQLLLSAGAAAAAVGRPAGDYIAMAKAGAARIGRRIPVYHSSFSPASVTMQAVHAYTLTRDAGAALAEARHIRPGDLTGISHGRHLLDVAQAHLDARHHDTAATRLLEARDQSPLWFRHQALARTLVADLRERETRPSRAVRSLARTLDLS